MVKSVSTSTTKRATSKKVPAVTTEITEGLPSATATALQRAQPEPKTVEGGASSSSAEALIATAQATGTGKATGQVVTGDLSESDSSSNQDSEPKYVRITSRLEGFRRAGMRHSKTPTDHPLGTFTDEQLAILETEPNLTVEYL